MYIHTTLQTVPDGIETLVAGR